MLSFVVGGRFVSMVCLVSSSAAGSSLREKRFISTVCLDSIIHQPFRLDSFLAFVVCGRFVSMVCSSFRVIYCAIRVLCCGHCLCRPSPPTPGRPGGRALGGHAWTGPDRNGSMRGPCARKTGKKNKKTEKKPKKHPAHIFSREIISKLRIVKMLVPKS